MKTVADVEKTKSMERFCLLRFLCLAASENAVINENCLMFWKKEKPLCRKMSFPALVLLIGRFHFPCEGENLVFYEQDRNFSTWQTSFLPCCAKTNEDTSIKTDQWKTIQFALQSFRLAWRTNRASLESGVHMHSLFCRFLLLVRDFQGRNERRNSR